jgi:hypothetical protein
VAGEGSMTKEQWDQVEKALAGIFGMVVLQVDGHKVSFKKEFVAKNKLGIATYVDGYWKGIWFSSKEEHPEQRYLKPVYKFLFKPKRRAEMKKFPKRLLKAMEINPDEKYLMYTPLWSSVTEIRRHYQKTFSSIELIEAV